MAKNVLGLSFGRKMSNTEVMVKQALNACKEAGHEVRFIRVEDLDIKDCTGCIACVVGMIRGGKGGCHLKDDFHILDEALMECDALIAGCPTYEMGPSGTYRTVCDRAGPSHDISFRKVAIEEGLAAGKDPATLPDQRCLKKRVGALFSVGGAMTKNWLVFTLPTMYALPMTMGIDIVDTYEYYGAMAYNHVVGNPPVMERMTELGRHVAEALACTDEAERRRWRGGHEGACPICHCDLLTLSDDRKSIECSVCGTYGSFTVEDGKLMPHFTPEQLSRSRLYYAGKLEHSTEIKTCAAPPGQIPDLKERLAPYRWE
ncbi:MAG: flavodoxin family protein [Oscillospiraceae bacterium]|nr:flavodoxin family protein [Oscillospiraceae bacterium]